MFEKLRKNLPRTQPNPRPSIVATTKIDKPRLIDVTVDNGASPSTISGTFGIDITNTGLLATRSLRITNAKIDLTKNEQSINIGEIKKPQQIKNIQPGQTRTVKIKFDRKSNFINQIGEDVCKAKEVKANIDLTVAEIILAATYSNKEKIKVNNTNCTLITVNIQGQENVNVNQEYTWEIVASDGSSPNNVEWDMGDGTTKSGTEVSHTYQREGVFDVVAETDGGNSDNIEVNAERLPLAIVGPTNVTVGKNNTWNPSGENVENLSGFSWSMGDGTTIEGEQASHSYGSEGTYTITLTSGEGTSTSLDIQSTFPNITIQQINGRQDVEDDSQYQWSVSGNNLDKAGEIRWNMGDGTIKYGQQVSHTYSSALESTINVSAKVAGEVVDSANSPILVRAIRLGSGEG